MKPQKTIPDLHLPRLSHLSTPFSLFYLGCLRPSIAEDATGTSGSNEDPLTLTLSEIVHGNEVIQQHFRGNVNKVRGR